MVDLSTRSAFLIIFLFLLNSDFYGPTTSDQLQKIQKFWKNKKSWHTLSFEKIEVGTKIKIHSEIYPPLLNLYFQIMDKDTTSDDLVGLASVNAEDVFKNYITAGKITEGWYFYF